MRGGLKPPQQKDEIGRFLKLHLQINRPGEQLGQAASRERDLMRSDLISTRQNTVMSIALIVSGAGLQVVPRFDGHVTTT
jgi:hypothetical protein